MSKSDRVPTVLQVLAAQAIVKADRRLGDESDPDILRDAEWPIEEALDYHRRAKPAR